MNADKLFSFAYVYLCVFSHLFPFVCVRITHAKITVVFGFGVHIPPYKSFGEGQGIPDQSSRLLFSWISLRWLAVASGYLAYYAHWRARDRYKSFRSILTISESVVKSQGVSQLFYEYIRTRSKNLSDLK